MDQSAEIKSKIVLIGNSGAGKTAIRNRAAKSPFPETYKKTIGAATAFKKTKIYASKLMPASTAIVEIGGESNESEYRLIAHNPNVIYFVFDLVELVNQAANNEELVGEGLTLEQRFSSLLNNQFEKFEKLIPENCVTFFLANKLDLLTESKDKNKRDIIIRVVNKAANEISKRSKFVHSNVLFLSAKANKAIFISENGIQEIEDGIELICKHAAYQNINKTSSSNILEINPDESENVNSQFPTYNSVTVLTFSEIVEKDTPTINKKVMDADTFTHRISSFERLLTDSILQDETIKSLVNKIKDDKAAYFRSASKNENLRKNDISSQAELIKLLYELKLYLEKSISNHNREYFSFVIFHLAKIIDEALKYPLLRYAIILRELCSETQRWDILTRTSGHFEELPNYRKEVEHLLGDIQQGEKEDYLTDLSDPKVNSSLMITGHPATRSSYKKALNKIHNFNSSESHFDKSAIDKLKFIYRIKDGMNPLKDEELIVEISKYFNEEKVESFIALVKKVKNFEDAALDSKVSHLLCNNLKEYIIAKYDYEQNLQEKFTARKFKGAEDILDKAHKDIEKIISQGNSSNQQINIKLSDYWINQQEIELKAIIKDYEKLERYLMQAREQFKKISSPVIEAEPTSANIDKDNEINQENNSKTKKIRMGSKEWAESKDAYILQLNKTIHDQNNNLGDQLKILKSVNNSYQISQKFDISKDQSIRSTNQYKEALSNIINGYKDAYKTAAKATREMEIINEILEKINKEINRVSWNKSEKNRALIALSDDLKNAFFDSELLPEQTINNNNKENTVPASKKVKTVSQVIENWKNRTEVGKTENNKSIIGKERTSYPFWNTTQTKTEKFIEQLENDYAAIPVRPSILRK